MRDFFSPGTVLNEVKAVHFHKLAVLFDHKRMNQ